MDVEIFQDLLCCNALMLAAVLVRPAAGYEQKESSELKRR
jgi:hypothetical protein